MSNYDHWLATDTEYEAKAAQLDAFTDDLDLIYKDKQKDVEELFKSFIEDMITFCGLDKYRETYEEECVDFIKEML